MTEQDQLAIDLTKSLGKSGLFRDNRVCGMLLDELRVDEGMSPEDWRALENGDWGTVNFTDPATQGVLCSLLSACTGKEVIFPCNASEAMEITQELLIVVGNLPQQ